MRRRSRAILLLAAIAMAGCATHLPGSPFEQAHRRALQMPAAPGPGLHVYWLGVSTLLFREGSDAILIDGFLSRPNLVQTVFGAIGPDAGAADKVLERVHQGAIGALFVAHAHHDHVLDASAIARSRRAVLYGSESVLNVAKGDGLSEQGGRLRRLEHGRSYPSGDFSVRAFATPHSETHFPMKGVKKTLHLPAHALAYSAGQNFSFLVARDKRRILVVPSAASKEGMFGTERAELVFLGIGTLGKSSYRAICEYWEEAVRQRGATQVILIHWDNFLYPPGVPLRTFSGPLDDVPHAFEALSALASEDHIGLHFVAPYQRIALPPPGAPGAEPPALPQRRACAQWTPAPAAQRVAAAAELRDNP